MISDNSGLFEGFQSAWDITSEWYQNAAAELEKSKVRELLSETCGELMLPDEVADLLVQESGAERAFEELIPFQHGKDFSEFYDLYLKDPREIRELSRDLRRMSKFLQKAHGTDNEGE